MTIDKQKLKALAWFTEDHMTDKSATTYDPAVACRWYEKGWPVQLLYGAETINELLMEISQLKAENEALRKALGKISVQVDGNIMCAVRDVVNGLPDVQDIYGYCDNIDEIIAAAMAKETNHG